MSCWAVYSCLFLTWVVVISWILELIVIVQIDTRIDSTLREQQIITIRLTSLSVLLIDNIIGLKCVCVCTSVGMCVHAIVICCMISPSGSVSRWQLAIIWTHFINLHHSVSLFQSLSLPAALLTAFHQWVKTPHSAIIILMLYWHECLSNIVASATKL